MAFKLNDSDNYEPIEIWLSKDKTPIAFENKVQELLELEAFATREEAEDYVARYPIELELYYEKFYGLFAVESGAVENGEVQSPYTGCFGEKCDD